MKRYRWTILLLLILLLTSIWGGAGHRVSAASQSAFEMVRYALTNGGGYLSGGEFSLNSSIGQASTALSQGGSFELRGGIIPAAATYRIYLPLTRR